MFVHNNVRAAAAGNGSIADSEEDISEGDLLQVYIYIYFLSQLITRTKIFFNKIYLCVK